MKKKTWIKIEPITEGHLYEYNAQIKYWANATARSISPSYFINIPAGEDIRKVALGTSGLTLEDIEQELLYEVYYALVHWNENGPNPTKDGTIPEDPGACVLHFLKWKSKALARKVKAKKRGWSERHLTGEEAAYKFGEIDSYGDD